MQPRAKYNYSMKRTLLAVFDACWLPVLLLVSCTWLFAPWLHHTHGGGLSLISGYERIGQPFGWWFRTGDVLGAAIVLLALLRARLWRKQPWLFWMLFATGLLAGLDAIFVDGCGASCSAWAQLSHQVHDIESVLSVATLAIAVGIDAFHNKRFVSQLFFGVLVAVGALGASSLLTRDQLIFVQYLYQIATVSWVAYILQQYLPHTWRPHAPAIRGLFGSMVFVAGLLEVMLAFHVRSYGIVPGTILRAEPVWLAQHSVVVGVILLYLSRYIYKGERRAAALVAIALATEIVKYSLITPNAYLLLFGELLAVILWVGWPMFNRNIGPPPLLARVKSLALTFGGIAVALALLIALANSSGRARDFTEDAHQVFVSSVHYHGMGRQQAARLRYRVTHIRYVSAGLGLSLIALTIYSFFRPADSAMRAQSLTPARARQLLEAYSSSSEDYFKLWPTDKSYFVSRHIDGFVAYKKVGSTAFALSDPVCSPHLREPLLDSFVTFCREHGWTACFIMVGHTSRSMYEHADLNVLQIGSSAVIDVATFKESTSHEKWWRWQLNRAHKNGLHYSFVQPPHSTDLLKELAVVSNKWLGHDGRSEQGFAMGYYDENYLQDCTLHLLRDADGRLVAFTNQVPMFNDLHQTTIDLIRFVPDVDGAMPSLLANMLFHLHEEGRYRKFDLGFVPLAQMDNNLAKLARTLGNNRFSAAGLEQFKNKFAPDWQPDYLAYDGDLVDLTALLARLEKVMKAE